MNAHDRTWMNMDCPGANFQSDLVLILMEQTQGLEAFPFSQPQSRSLGLTSLELGLQLLIQMHGDAWGCKNFTEFP